MIDIVSEMLGVTPTKVSYVGGGGNSKVYKVTLPDNRIFALKDYLSTSVDPSERLQKEYFSLKYLVNNGVNVVPKPLCKNDDKGLAIYSWIKGDAILEPNDSDITEILSFMDSLHKLRDKTNSDSIARATESCFSANDIVKQINNRIDRLKSVNNFLVNKFLANNFIPVYENTLSASKLFYKENNISFNDEIQDNIATLTASDFGFHNALRSNTTINFLDFEYFGWDDPVKVISDFVWHPAMSITDQGLRFFIEKSFHIYSDDEFLSQRLKALFPLFGLRWVLIILNEFLPEKWERRKQAKNMSDSELDKIEKEQLCKAEKILEKVSGRYEQLFT